MIDADSVKWAVRKTLIKSISIKNQSVLPEGSIEQEDASMDAEDIFNGIV